MSLGRALAIWLGSYVIVATVLVVCCKVPLGPLILGGVLTCAGTILRFFVQRRSRF